jgi:hypothetical protein
MRDFNGSPRFSTGYVPLRNRPAILIETHMLKDYGARVRATYDFLRFILTEVNRDPQKLLQAGREADEKTVQAGSVYAREHQFPLRYELTEESRPFDLLAVESTVDTSDISGDKWVVFETRPLKLVVPMFDSFRVTRAVAPPRYYIVPPQWREVIENLKHQGLTLQRTIEPAEFEVESYRFSDVSWAAAPFEGRFLTTFKTEPISERRLFPAGSVVVPLAQAAAKVAISLLEPDAPDSLVAWGFFSAIFEEKEYGENYILEKLAREMLAADETLRTEFEALLKDSAFASSPRRRLEFFYRRSRYWDPFINLYPVGRVLGDLSVKVEDLS